MKVTKEWLIQTISKIPDNTELDITGHDYGLFIKLDPDYKKPERVEYPPDDIYPCKVFGTHMWGFNSCRHCDDPWPEPYRTKRLERNKSTPSRQFKSEYEL